MLNLQEPFTETSAPMQIDWISFRLDEPAADHTVSSEKQRSSTAFCKIHILGCEGMRFRMCTCRKEAPKTTWMCVNALCYSDRTAED